MDGKEYTFVAMRHGEIWEEPDLRRYASDWFDTLHFQTGDGDARMVVFPAMGAWAINGKLLRVTVDGRVLLDHLPAQLRQYKAARSYFVGADSFEILREFHLDATFSDPDLGHLRLDVGYSFEANEFFFKVLPLDGWAGQIQVTYDHREVLDVPLTQGMAGLLF